MSSYGTRKINEQGHLEIGEVDTTELVKKYGTPLYVYDVEDICNRANELKEAFDSHHVSYQVAYASKAFNSIAMIQLANELNLSLDVVSSGELYTALQAGFPRERIHLHGNNKSHLELEMAVKEEIGCIVVDNFTELSILSTLTQSLNKNISVLIRITPGIEAHTHEYISTGQEDSKFGFDIQSGQAEEAIKRIQESEFLQLDGVHSHIGSQIFETEGFTSAIQEVYKFLAKWKESLQFEPKIVNVGGGFGIKYVDEDKPLLLKDYVDAIVSDVKREAKENNMTIPEIWIEPGRALVGEAGTTLYTLGARKEIPNIRTYLSVDGGMADNIRPALYEAKYTAGVANKMNAAVEEVVSIAGKACESGDMLIWDLPIPKTEPGDILAVYSTGAYGYSMASNYNRLARPAVIFVEDGTSQCVINRESLEDIVRNDQPYRRKNKKQTNLAKSI